MMPVSGVKYSLFSLLQVHCSKSHASSQGSLLSTSGKNSTAPPEPKKVGGDSSLTLLRDPSSQALNPVRRKSASSYMMVSTGCSFEACISTYFVSDPVNCGLDVSRRRPVTATGVCLLICSSFYEVINELLFALFAEVL
jgi:hypothetical protein